MLRASRAPAGGRDPLRAAAADHGLLRGQPARRQARAHVPAHDLASRILEGPRLGRDHRLRRWDGAGLPARLAEGDHGADPHAPRVRRRDGSPVHRDAVARCSRSCWSPPGPSRASCSTGSCRSCSDSSTPRGCTCSGWRCCRPVQRDPDAAPVPVAAPGGRGLALTASSPGGERAVMRPSRDRDAAFKMLVPRWSLVMFAALTTRLWFLQVLAAEQYKARGERQRRAADRDARAARRDQRRERTNALVDNRVSVVITVNRQELGDETERVLYDLSQLLDIPADELGYALDDPGYYVVQPDPGRDRRAAARRVLHQGARRRVPRRRRPAGARALVPVGVR